jgi:CubicO group peptidase (beta-lactamase class C family)
MKKKKILLGIFTGLILLIILYAVAYLITPWSQLARAIVWLDSGVEDYKLFPSREVRNAVPTYYFRQYPDPSPYSSAFRTIKYTQNGDEITQDFDHFMETTDTTAFLVIKDDFLLYEKYFNGYDTNSTQTSFSIAKSFVSALVGIAIDEGYIDSVNDPITKYIPELEGRDDGFSRITIQHLLTMSSGIKFVRGFTPWSDDTITYYSTDLRKVALNSKIIEEPGATFLYNDYNPILLGIILERVTGQPVSEYLEQKLWVPLGMEAPGSWSLDSDQNQFEKISSGINGRAIDFAKFGRLYLNNGDWDGQQIIPSAWVEESTRPDTTSDPAEYYQYLWWITAWETKPGEVSYRYVAVGDHGQYIHIFPDQELIFVRFGKSEGRVEWGLVFESIAEEIREIDGK